MSVKQRFVNVDLYAYQW